MKLNHVSSVLRTSTVLLRPTLEVEQRLRDLANASSILWNTANYERRQAFYERQKIPSYADQCRTLKDNEVFKTLGTCKAQALLSKLNEAWRSFFALLRLKKSGKLPSHIKKLSPPRYWKQNGKRQLKGFCVRNDGWKMDEETISVSKELKISYQCGQLWVGKQGRLEVVRDDLREKWYAHIPVEVQYEPPSRICSKKASLDLGICNLATLYIEGKRPIIFSGRAVLSDWVYHTKKMAERQSNLPKRKHVSKQIRISFRKRQRRLRHSINSMLRSIFETLELKDVGELIIGDLKGIRENTNHGKSGNQKIHNFWPYGLVEKRIKELGAEYGITIAKVSERDTSKTCSLCGKRHNGRIHRGLMVCKDAHQTINADVNGAINIMKVAVNRPLSTVLSTTVGGASGSGLMAEPLLLRWNYNEWR